MADIFLSHSSQDEAIAKIIADRLIQEGLSVWCFERGSKTLENHIKTSIDEITKSRYFLLLVSKNAIIGDQERKYIYQEILRANDQNLKFIPVFFNISYDEINHLEPQWAVIIKSRSTGILLSDTNLDSVFRKIIHEIQHSDSKVSVLGSCEGSDNGRPQSLVDLMEKPDRSIIVWGHTLKKFAISSDVKTSLGRLLARGVDVTLILTNPFSKSEEAHQVFPHGGGDAQSITEIHNTIQFIKTASEFFTRWEGDESERKFPTTFSVILSNYLPRYRLIVVDDEILYLNIYTYGEDVNDTPLICLSKYDAEGKQRGFDTIVNSLNKLLTSRDIQYLVKNGAWNENWRSSEVGGLINSCLKNQECCNQDCTAWTRIEKGLLGYQNEDPAYVTKVGVCDTDYEPGTFTINLIDRGNRLYHEEMSRDEWLDIAIRDEIEAVAKENPHLLGSSTQKNAVKEKVKRLLQRDPLGRGTLLDQIWFQEYSDIFRRIVVALLTGNPDYEIEMYRNLTSEREESVLRIIEKLEEDDDVSLRDWLRYSISAGMLCVDEKTIHAATSYIDVNHAIHVPRGQLNKKDIKDITAQLKRIANSDCRVDASERFFHTLEMHRNESFSIVSLPDDFLESIILVKYYSKLLEEYPYLTIHCVPKSIKCGNDATYNDIIRFKEKFVNKEYSDRFNVIECGPKISGINLLKLDRRVVEQLKRADLVDVRGCRNYEMMQGLNVESFFGFIVCRDISESVTGFSADEVPFMYIHQPPGTRSFTEYKKRNQKISPVTKKMIAETTVRDAVKKWQGGHIASINDWSSKRREVFEINRQFYTSHLTPFEQRFGDVIEYDVQESLRRFTGRVLVLGCGSGKEVLFLSRNGCDAYGLDYSYEAIKSARKRSSGVSRDHFSVEDVYNLDIIEGTDFDGIIANAVFVHLLENDDIVPVFQMAWDKLKDGGLFYVRVLKKEGIRSDVDPNQFNVPRYFVYYTLDEIRDIAEQTGFTVLEESEKPHQQGHRGVYWIAVCLMKHSDGTRHPVSQVSPSRSRDNEEVRIPPS